MKKVFPVLLLMLAFGINDSFAQKKMKSPPASAKGTIDGVEVRVDYHQPSARDREVMGSLVPYDQVWRTGANGSTDISFSEDVTIEGEALAKGKYSLFTIPGEDEWTIIFNSETEQWGTQYNEEADVLRVTVDAGGTDEFVETFDISIDGSDVVLTWENTEVRFEVSK